ncbi:MAG: nucleoside deaminase, partial [Bacteroidales bacterium]|nr:nucleoside deaminase [Bacteroidales bacterium]
MENNEKFMRLAIEKSLESVDNGGGPFGAVVVKDGEVVAVASNSVTLDNDPTAHAEVNAIRMACKKLGTFDLSGCEIYASCEPCPMCLASIYWARIGKLYYANTKVDADKIGFSDSFIYEE